MSSVTRFCSDEIEHEEIGVTHLELQWCNFLSLFLFFFFYCSLLHVWRCLIRPKKSAQRYYQRIFKRAEGSHCSACWECAVTCFTSVLHFRNLAGDLNPPLLFGFSSNCREISLEEIHFLPIGVLLAVVWEIHVCCSVWAAQNRTENVKW